MRADIGCLREFLRLVPEPLKNEWMLKGLFRTAFLARVVFWFAFVVAIFMGHENGDKQRPTKRRHVRGMLDETDSLS